MFSISFYPFKCASCKQFVSAATYYRGKHYCAYCTTQEHELNGEFVYREEYTVPSEEDKFIPRLEKEWEINA